MKIVVQRVKQASVEAEGNSVGKIGKGLLILFGVHKEDVSDNTLWLVNKVLNLRIFEDGAGKMNLSVKDVQGEVLVVSQFTLYANCTNGRRPDFIESAPPEKAIPLYEKFVAEVKAELGQVQTGIFGAYMQVSLINDGPVTIILETKTK